MYSLALVFAQGAGICWSRKGTSKARTCWGNVSLRTAMGTYGLDLKGQPLAFGENSLASSFQ